MIVVNPNNTSHSIKVVLRTSFVNTLKFEITNDITKITLEPDSVLFIPKDRSTTINFDFNFSNLESYQVKITDLSNNEIVYRDLLFATQENTQQYRLTSGKYYY